MVDSKLVTKPGTTQQHNNTSKGTLWDGQSLGLNILSLASSQDKM